MVVGGWGQPVFEGQETAGKVGVGIAPQLQRQGLRAIAQPDPAADPALDPIVDLPAHHALMDAKRHALILLELEAKRKSKFSFRRMNSRHRTFFRWGQCQGKIWLQKDNPHLAGSGHLDGHSSASGPGMHRLEPGPVDGHFRNKPGLPCKTPRFPPLAPA
jgi:hypothetical protein